jgi:predicted membrane protein
MDKSLVSCGVLLVLAGLTGVIYGVGINVESMMARGATDYSFITAYITEWVLVLLAGVVLVVTGARRH